jgi:hypothetical protein
MNAKRVSAIALAPVLRPDMSGLRRMERRICFGGFRRRCEDALRLAAGCFTGE